MPRRRTARPFELIADRDCRDASADIIAEVEGVAQLGVATKQLVDVCYCEGAGAVVAPSPELDGRFGLSGRVRQHSWSELGPLRDAGSIATLAQLLERCAAQPLILNLDLTGAEEATPLIDGLRELLTGPERSHLTLMCEDPKFGSSLAAAFPAVDLYLGTEPTLRPIFEEFPGTGSGNEYLAKVVTAFQAADKIYEHASTLVIDAKASRYGMTQALGALGYRIVFSSGVRKPTEPDTSLQVCKWSYAYGNDGQFVPELAPEFVASWKSFLPDPATKSLPGPEFWDLWLFHVRRCRSANIDPTSAA